MGRRLMTLSDLYSYYSTQGKTQRFSSKNDGDTIVVQIDGKLNFSKSDSIDGLYPTRVQMNFVGDNLNGSRIQMKAQEAALPSSHYRPLLACIHEVDGEPQFYGHNMHQEDGELVYDEQPVGVIVEEAHIEHDDEYDMDYAVALGYIWEEYSKAAYIIDRDQRCDVSVELSIRSLSYDAKDGILVLDDFYYSGCTILGYDENGKKINPAMPGSNITLADFSAKENSTVDSDKLSQILDKLNIVLAKFEEKSKEGGNQIMFEQLLEKYGKTVEDVTFEHENLTDEELEVAFAKAFAEVEGDDNGDGAEPEAPASDEPTEDEPTDDNNDLDDEPTEDEEPKVKDEYSVTIKGETKTFGISMNAKIEALSTLINDTYADDMAWYCVEAYDDDKQVVMIDCWTGKAYRQSYKVKDDVFSLKGDRVPVHSMWVTDDEQKAFDELKSKFELVSDKLAKYESEPKKVEILESAKYGYVSQTDEFINLKENHFDLSVDEVSKEADKILLSYAERGELKFAEQSLETVPTVTQKKFVNSDKKQSRYGNLFK